jgi:hypothetical protein
MQGVQANPIPREVLDKMFDFEIEFKASGVRREDGLTAAEVKAELDAQGEDE